MFRKGGLHVWWGPAYVDKRSEPGIVRSVESENQRSEGLAEPGGAGRGCSYRRSSSRAASRRTLTFSNRFWLRISCDRIFM